MSIPIGPAILVLVVIGLAIFSPSFRTLLLATAASTLIGFLAIAGIGRFFG